MRTATRRGIFSAVLLGSLTFTGCFSYQSYYPEYRHASDSSSGDCTHCRNKPGANHLPPVANQPMPSGPLAKRLPDLKKLPQATIAQAPYGRPGAEHNSAVVQTAYPAPGQLPVMHPAKGPSATEPISTFPTPVQRTPSAHGVGLGHPQEVPGKNGKPADPSSPPIVIDEFPHGPLGIPGPGPIPTELSRVSLPPYTIAPPDILFIDAIRLVPKPPYMIEALETLLINVADTLPGQPIAGPFIVSPEGTIDLGFSYGTARVGGLTLDQANAAIRSHLGKVLRNPQVTVALAQIRAFQQIRGEHLVRPDGTISLGTYGSVYVAGLTLGQVKCVLERYLSDYVVDPKISVDVFAYNSKVYYVIVDGAGFGQQVFPFPITGNETVLDAVAKVGGLAPQSSKRRIWVARPSPCHNGCNQILPVDWRALTEGGSTCTNYQIFPGDRVYVAPDRFVLADNLIGKVLAPVERVLGITFLGVSTYQAFTGNLFNNN